MIKHSLAIFEKQLKDTFKNKTILIQFVMFPVLSMIMENAITIQDMPRGFFTKMFATMYIGMAPLTSMAAIISEEKEKNTLKALLMSNVKPMAYLIGVGVYIWLICMIGSGIIALSGQYKGAEAAAFMLVMGIGILVSILIGAAIGTWSKNQMIGTSLTVPVMLVFSFLPMLAMFNKDIEVVAKITYSQQISLLISEISSLSISIENIGVIVMNMMLAIGLFIIAYKKCGLE